MSLSRLKSYIVVLFLVAAIPLFSSQAGALTWDECRQKVLTGSPVIKAADMQEKAAEARALQAGGLKPSRVAVELENFGASGELKSEDPLETTFSVSQELEVSGKRGAGIEAGRFSARATAMDRELTVRNTLAEARIAFAEVIAAKERSRLAGEALKLSGSLAGAVRKKADAGRVAPLESDRADVELSLSETGSAKADRQVSSALDRLAAICGITNSAGFDVSGKISDLSGFADKPDLSGERIKQLVSDHPEFLKAEALISQRKAELTMVRRQYIPAVELSAGIKQYEASGDSAYVASVGLDIPLFSRNGRAVDAAENDYRAAESVRDAVRLNLENRLRTLVLDLQASEKQLLVLLNKAVPAADRAYLAAEEGYNQGKFGYLDVLEARRAMLDTGSIYIDTWLEHEKLVAGLDVFTGSKRDN